MSTVAGRWNFSTVENADEASWDELVDVNLKGAWTGPAALTLSSHALAPLAELPVLEIVSGMHILADLTLPLGKVVHDYLA